MFKKFLYGSTGLLILSGLLIIRTFAIQDQVLPGDGSFYDSVVIQQMKNNLTIATNLTVGNAITAASANVTSVTIGQQSVAGISASGAITGQNLTARNSLTVNTNATIGGTVDAAAFTVDAGAGLDNQAAGALLLGAATATSVEIADASVPTDIQGSLSVDEQATFDGSVTCATARVNGILSLENGEYFSNVQDTYIKVSGHLVSLGDGTFNLGSSTQQFGYLYLQSDIAAEDGTFRDGLTVNTNLTLPALTASKPVFTDANKILTSSGTLGADQGGTGVASPTDHAVLVGSGASAVTPITVGANGELLIGQTSGDPAFKPGSGAWTIDEGGTNVLLYGIDAAKLTTNSTPPALNMANATNTPITVTPQAPSVHTPTITLTPQTGAVTASGANNLVTPTATMTPETGAVTAEGANNLATLTATMTLESVVLTNYSDPVYQYGTFTNENFSVTNVFSTVTGMTWTTTIYTGLTNASCAITPDVPTNAVVAVSVTGGSAIWTNATCAITPDLASNTVVVVSVTGGGAVWTNAAGASSALPLFITNAIATNP